MPDLDKNHYLEYFCSKNNKNIVPYDDRTSSFWDGYLKSYLQRAIFPINLSINRKMNWIFGFSISMKKIKLLIPKKCLWKKKFILFAPKYVLHSRLYRQLIPHTCKNKVFKYILINYCKCLDWNFSILIIFFLIGNVHYVFHSLS